MGKVTTDNVHEDPGHRVLTLSRTLKALRNSSKALAHAAEEGALLKEICRIIVEDCGHAMVWIGLAENDAGKSIRPAAYAGFEEGYLETLGLTWADTERGRGPTGRAIRTGEICLCRNMLTDPAFAPWRDEALRRGYASSIVFPLSSNGAVIGALSLYSRLPDPFTADECKLLSDLAEDVAFGICALRNRTESKRSQRERDLTIAFLRMVNVSKDSGELLRTSALFFRKHAECDAVGIRLRSGNDFPYCQTLGFSQTFLEAERTLCTHGEAGEDASLACVCGKVITGNAGTGGLTFTSHGSFCSNDSPSLLQLPFDSTDLIRGRCIQEGYGSIALLPLHDGPMRLGLVQLNAWRKGAFPPEALSLWERLADHLAVAVAKFQTQAALRASEELNRQTLRALPAHIAVIDRDGRVEAVNDAWANFARENSASDASAVQVGSNYLEVCRRAAAADSADAGQALAGIEAVLAGGRSLFTMEYACHSPHEKRWFLMTVVPYGSGGEGGAVITHLNITDRKKAEEDLRASEQRIQQALRVSHSFTFDWVPATDAVLRSDSCSTILGLTGKSANHDTGQRYFQRVHPDDRARFVQMLYALHPDADSYTTEYHLSRDDNTVVVLEETGKAVFDDAGKLQRLVGVCTDITKRKKAEQQLVETTQRLQALMTAVPVGISFSDDATCQRVSGNPAVLAQFEVTLQDNLSASAPSADEPGRKVQFFLGGRPLADYELPLQRAVAENSVIPPMELEVLLPSGRRWFADASGAPVRDAQGRVIGGIAVTVDITEHKRADDALRASEERLRLVLKASEMGTFEVDLATGEGRWNTVEFELLGLRPGELPGNPETFFRFVHPDDVAGLRKQWEDALRSGFLEAEFRVIRADGVLRWLAAKGQFVFEDSKEGRVPEARGRALRFMGVNFDITARKQTEEVLRFLGQCGTSASGEGFFQELARYLAHALDMDFVCIDRLEEGLLTAQTLAVFHNGEFKDNVSYTLKDTPCGDVVGKRICVFPQNVRRLFAKDAVLQNLQAESYLGTTLWGAQGTPIGLIAVIGRQPLKDTRQAESILQMAAVRVSGELERLQAEQAITRLNAQLEQRVASRTEELASTNRELEAFCYSVSHDLRAPLRSMDGFSLALLEDYGAQLDAAGQDFLNRIRSNCQRLARLIDDLLHLSRLTRAQMRHQPVDLTALAQAVIAELRQAEPDRTVDVLIAPGLVVNGDPVLLRTALGNLLQNAWKFTSQRADAVIEMGVEDGGQRTADGRQRTELRPPSSPVFFVRDNGVGFDMQYADKLFTPFQRLHAMTEFPGSGIGLATVQRVIHRHNGRLWFESAPGQGATFFFTTGGGA